MSERHAYLIACHNNPYILQKLLLSLDDERNDIYIHADKRWKDLDKTKILATVKKSNITFVKRYKVNWGGYTQIKSSLALLSEAAKTEHSYYHFLSGVDMPLKTQDYIHNFFKENNGKEFVVVDKDSNLNPVNTVRIKYYYPFQDILGREEYGVYRYVRYAHNIFLDLQKKLGVNRLKELEGRVFKGANWFSITHGFAKHIVENKRYIKKHFSQSLCADELVIQTLLMNSEFGKNKAEMKIRHIDWKRGAPYTFRSEDLEELKNAQGLFARKFDEKVDLKIVDEIYSFIAKGGKK